MTAPAAAVRAAAPPRRRAPARRRDWPALLYVVPALAFFTAFVLVPLGQAVWLSLWEWDGVTTATWAGAANYTAALADPAILEALRHSLVFVVFYALLPTAVGLALTALMTRVRIRGLTFFRAALFVPQILSGVVVAVAWRWMYDIDGPVNGLLRLVGLDGAARSWLGEFSTALPSVGLVGTWVMYGLCMVLFLAGAQRIPAELYEAARIDGAGPLREFLTVTLPGLRRETAFALVLTVTQALRNFDIVWNTTSGGPGTTTTVPSVYIVRAAFTTRDYGTAAAISVLLTVLILAVTGLVLLLFRERKGAAA
ncbi:carbohydrate ABC transporter permease [Nocardiopsis trehalosi]|uniref:carbohydrate ABC transporter permease n=1 Tax=Nocardiopsis trehalosi TaxID=109329 RepID=UPI000831F166|nr:sugar ABC transporter permease [Nocardiopsis trehalosi]